MKPNKIEHVAKFHTPLPHENPNQVYDVLEIIEDEERSGADIKALNIGLSFPFIITVKLDDIEIIEIDTSDRDRNYVTINKADYSKVRGKVLEVSEQKILHEFSKGVETNVSLTIEIVNEKEHLVTLFEN